jgi:hypothetical protein
MIRRVLLAAALAVVALSARAQGIAPNSVTSSTLELWLKADAGCLNSSATACTNGQSVATWQDQSGNGHNATQGGCGAEPTYVASAFANGKPALNFVAGSSQCLTAGYAGAAGTIIVVYYNSAAPGNYGNYYDVIAGMPQSGAAITAYDIYADTEPLAGPAFNVRVFSYGTTSNSGNYSWYTEPERIRNLWSISGMTEDGTTLTSYEQDSVLATATIPGGASVYTATGQVIGAGDFGGSIGSGPSYFQGLIAEVIIFQGKISASDYAGVVAYELNKYGLTPSGSYLMMAENSVNGDYTDSNLYLLEGDGTHWSANLPVNYVPTVLPGQSSTVELAMTLLHDDEDNLVRYNGLFWAEGSRCAYSNGQSWPCQYVDILYDAPDANGLPTGNWTLAGTIDCDTVGITNGSSSTRGCYNNDWFIDRGHGNAVYALIGGSNNEESNAGVQEWGLAITLNSNGTFTTGTLTAMAGSALPFGSTGTNNSGFYLGAIVDLSGTYYAFLTNVANVGTTQYATSSSPLTGYNGTLGTLSGTGSPPIEEWQTWLQAGGNGTLYIDETGGDPYGVFTASDGAFGTVAGVTAATALSFEQAGSAPTFHPQGAGIYKLPAICLGACASPRNGRSMLFGRVNDTAPMLDASER